MSRNLENFIYKLAEDNGYDGDTLMALFIETLDDLTFDEFIAITKEHDWRKEN